MAALAAPAAARGRRNWTIGEKFIHNLANRRHKYQVVANRKEQYQEQANMKHT